MFTRVVFELDERTIEGDAVLASLGVSLRNCCEGFDITVIPRYTGVNNCRIANGIIETAATALKEIEAHPQTELCIYLSPRTIALPGRAIASTIFVIRDRARLLAARVQVMHEEALRPLVRQALQPEMDLAKARLFADRKPSKEEEMFADHVSNAIRDGYMQAHTFLYSHAGHA